MTGAYLERRLVSPCMFASETWKDSRKCAIPASEPDGPCFWISLRLSSGLIFLPRLWHRPFRKRDRFRLFAVERATARIQSL